MNFDPNLLNENDIISYLKTKISYNNQLWTDMMIMQTWNINSEHLSKIKGHFDFFQRMTGFIGVTEL